MLPERTAILRKLTDVSSEIVSGTIVTLLVTDAKGYDLIGEICSEEDDE